MGGLSKLYAWRSEALGAQQRISKVDEQDRSHRAAEEIVDEHEKAPSERVAGRDIGERGCEEAEREREHGDIHCRGPFDRALPMGRRMRTRLPTEGEDASGSTMAGIIVPGA
ncbi:hypothetical protein OCUBac02_11370 [Bosea sp. ANAM02]|nr:hypothetical protein OCUBac02_11370 [Bosea sp. ANAM02]